MSKEESKYGFKDVVKAVESLKLLETEEMQYQKLTVRGLIGRAKRVLTSKNPEIQVPQLRIETNSIISL